MVILWLLSSKTRITCFFCVCPPVQVHLEFIKVCMLRLERIYEGLQQYKPGEIDKEPQEIQQGYNTEVRQCACVVVHCIVCIVVGRSFVGIVQCTCMFICEHCHKVRGVCTCLPCLRTGSSCTLLNPCYS